MGYQMTEEQIARRCRIFADGAIAAATGRGPRPPDELGSMEWMIWYDGYAYHAPSFRNPYRIGETNRLAATPQPRSRSCP